MTTTHDHMTPNRRKSVLTEDDLLAIQEVLSCSKCSFTADEADTLKSFAKNVNRTQKIAFVIIVTSVVTSILAGVVAAIKYYIVNFLMKGIK